MNIIDSGNNMTVLSGETAADLTVYGGITVVSGGIVNESVISGGSAVVYGEANDIAVNTNGVISVGSNGGEVVEQNEVIEGAEELPVYTGGVVNRTEVSEKGTMHVLENGTANDTVVGGVQAAVLVSGGGVANGTWVKKSGTLAVGADALASESVVFSGGAMYVDGTASDVVVSGGTFAVYDGGNADSVNVYRGGSASVNSGGEIVDTVVNAGGELKVTFNGIASNVTVTSGASLVIGGGQKAYHNSATVSVIPEGIVSANGVTGGILTGVITIENGAVVTAEKGAMLVFDLGTDAGENGFYINNLSAVQGDSACYITVDGNATNARYTIAQNINGYTGTYYVGSGNDYSTYTAVGIGDVFGNDFMLRNVGGNLVFCAGVMNVPEIRVTAGDVTGEIGVCPENLVQEVSINVTFDIVADKNYYKIGNGVWIEYAGTLTVKQNAVVYFRSEDAHGYISESSVEINNIDRIVPTLEITGPKTGAYQTIELVAEVADNRSAADNVVVKYSVDNCLTWNDMTGNTLTIGQNGTVYFKAVDEAGNESEIVEWDVNNIDTVAPAAPVIYYDGNAAYNGIAAQQVVLTADFHADAESKLYSVDGGATWVEYTGEGVVVNSEGVNNVLFKSYDEAGNESAISTSEGVIIDLTAPDAPVVTQNTYDPAQSVQLTAVSGEGARIEYKIAGVDEEWKVYDAASGLNITAENTTVIFSAVDVAGNRSEEYSHVISNVDTTAPGVPVATVGEKDENGNIQVTAVFDNDTVGWFSVNGGAQVRYDGAVTFTATGVVEFWAVDAAGNAGERVTVAVDLTAPDQPVIESVSRDNNVVANEDVIITAVFSADSVKKEYSFDGEEWFEYNPETGVVVAENGTVKFRGQDIIGNISEVTDYIVANIDKVPPAAPVAIADITDATNQPVSVMAIFDEFSVSNEYSVDGGNTWHTYNKAVTFTQNGSVTFRSCDEYGNYSYDTWVVDYIKLTPPEAPVAGADITEMTNSDVTVTATFDAESVRNEYSVNGGEWQRYKGSEPFEYVFAENGTIQFRSWDEVGNCSETTYVVSNIDKAAPDTPAATADITNATNGNVIVSAVFAADSVLNEYTLDGNTWYEYVSGIEFEQNGTVVFRSTDAAGNVSAEFTYVVSNIDKEAPALPVVIADNAPTNQNVIVSAEFAADSVLNEYSLDGNTWYEYVSGIEFEQNGIIMFRSTDAVGNVSEVVPYAVENIDKVDPIAPKVYFSTRELAKNVTVTASSEEADVTVQYKIDGVHTQWQNYTEQLVIGENCTIIFRSIDAAGNFCNEVHYEVTNIDNTAPELAASADITTATQSNVTVTAVCGEADAKIQYFIEGVTADWTDYVDGVVMENNGTVLFRAEDAVGNVSKEVEYIVDCIDREAPVKPAATADIETLTNDKVTVSAVFAEDSVLNEYSTDGGATWLEYTANGVVIDTNKVVVLFRSTDAAGNVSEVERYLVNNIDKVAPDAPDATANTTVITKEDVTVTATFAADSVRNEYSTNGTDWFEYENAVVVSENGYVKFRSWDEAGNVSDEFVYIVNNIDKTAPLMPEVAADIVAPTNGDVKITAVFAADSVKNEYSLDGATWVEYTGAVTVNENGKVYFRATDLAGNVSEIAEYEVTNIDTVGPDAPVCTADVTDVTNGSITVTAAFAADSVRNEYSLDGNTWYEYTQGIVLTEEGSVVSFRSWDEAGNVSGVTEYIADLIDKTAPDAPVVSVDIIDPTNKNVTVAAEFASDSVRNEYSVNGGEWLEYNGNVIFTENGNVSFRSWDAAGNVSKETTYVVDYIDRTAPEKPVATADITDATNGNVIVSAEFAEYFKNEYSVDGGATWQLYTTGVEVAENGNIIFRSWDAAGNFSEETYTVSNIDKVAPVKPVATADIKEATNGNVIVSAEFAEDFKNEYSVDGGATWQLYTTGVEFAENGNIIFRSWDEAGNHSEEIYTVSNIDKVAPVAPVAKADVAEATNGKVVVSAEFAEDFKNEYSVDGGATWQLYTTGFEFAENGKILFRSWDEAGNVSEVTEYEVANIDKAAPVKPVVVADITEVTDKSVTLMATFAADAARNEYSIDGGEWQICNGSVLVNDNATVSFRSLDAAGNVSEVTDYIVANIDKAAPDAPKISQDVNELTAGNVTVTAVFAADSVKNEYSLDDGATWLDYNSAIVMTGNGNITFRSTDALGNAGEVIYTVSNIDKVAPNAPVVSADVTEMTTRAVLVTAVFAADSVKNEYSLDGGATWLEYEQIVAFHRNGTVMFRSTDAVGNVSEIVSYEVTNIDCDAPEAPVVSASATKPTNKAVTVTAEFAADSVKNEYSIDGGTTWLEYTAGIEFAENGTISFRSTDALGNTSSADYTVDNIDKIAPDAPVVSKDVTDSTNGVVTVTAVFAADSVLNGYSLDGINWQVYTEPIVFTENGTVMFYSVDAAGNLSELTMFTVDNIDKTAPDAPVAYSNTTAWTKDTVTVCAAFAADSVKNEYSLDGVMWFACPADGVTVNDNGVISFRSADAAGNYSKVTSYEVSNFDRVAPEITVEQIRANNVITFNAVVTDSGCGVKLVEYSLDNKNWYVGDSVTLKGNGAVYFRATDNLGNVSFTNEIVDYIVEHNTSCDLLGNGTSQIVGYDAASGKVGYVAVDGKVSPEWRGVWDWDDSEALMWQVCGVGKFSGSCNEQDGILLKNKTNNTFAAWTDLGRGDYGYVSLGYVDGNFDAVCLGNLGGEDCFDDVIISNESGSFGVMLDGVEYRDIWNASSADLDIWQVEGVGSFDDSGEQLVVTNKIDGVVYLWQNLDTTFSTWNWNLTALENPGENWTVAAIGDFEGDGIDDIIFVDTETRNVWAWDNGNASDKRWCGTLGEGFQIEAAGDYNGDGKDDLLLREYNTGWGGMGYWGSGFAGNWVDLNARIETDLESKFAVIS